MNSSKLAVVALIASLLFAPLTSAQTKTPNTRRHNSKANKHPKTRSQADMVKKAHEAQQKAAQLNNYMAQLDRQKAEAHRAVERAKKLLAQARQLEVQVEARRKTLLAQRLSDQASPEKTRPDESPMLRRPSDDHTYSIPNARQSLPDHPTSTTITRKPDGPYNFLGTKP